MSSKLNIDQLKKKFKERDRVMRCISKNANFRISIIRNTQAAITAGKRHNLDHALSLFLAKTLAAASMLASFLKGEERISIEIRGNGRIARIFAEAIHVGEVRGYAEPATGNGNSETIASLSDAIGEGTLSVTRMLYDSAEPTQGITQLQNGDVETSLAYYFTQSEQIPSAVILDVSIDDNGLIEQSGGLIIQALPGASDAEIIEVYKSLSEMQSLSSLLKNGMQLDEILKIALPFEFDIIKNYPVDFFCRCSKANFISKLKTLEYNEIEDMRKMGQNELVCHYCNEKYYLDDADFDSILEELKAKKN